MTKQQGLVMTVVELAPDRSVATLKMSPAPAEYFTVTAESAVVLLGFLGEVRANLLPAVEIEWISSKPIKAWRPRKLFAVESDAFGDVLMHVRDERFGWQHYVMTKEDALAIGEKLIESAGKGPTAGRA